MKVLNLIIKQSYFNQIVEGTKTKEYREVKPTTAHKLIQEDENGYEICDEHGNGLPIKYDALQLFVGYNKNRDSMLVEVTDSYTELYVDDDNQPIQYEIENPNDPDNPDVWVAERVVYCLGKILELNKKK